MLSGDVRTSGLGIVPLSYVSLRGSVLLKSKGCLSSFLILVAFAVVAIPAFSCNKASQQCLEFCSVEEKVMVLNELEKYSKTLCWNVTLSSEIIEVF
jgi:hypothetical protein